MLLLFIFREQNLLADIYRCHFTLSGFYVSNSEIEKALQEAKKALDIARKRKDHMGELEALTQMGQVKNISLVVAFTNTHKSHLYFLKM